MLKKEGFVQATLIYVIIFFGKGEWFTLSPALLKMYVSFAGMGFMFLSLIILYFSRYKLKGFLKFITAVIAYFFMATAGLIIFFVVFSGPTSS
jgi:hypothetical protein